MQNNFAKRRHSVLSLLTSVRTHLACKPYTNIMSWKYVAKYATMENFTEGLGDGNVPILRI